MEKVSSDPEYNTINRRFSTKIEFRRSILIQLRDEEKSNAENDDTKKEYVEQKERMKDYIDELEEELITKFSQ